MYRKLPAETPPLEQPLVLRILKALADGNRLGIVRAITRSGELSCGDVARRFPIAQATVSHHLKILVDAGIVDVRRAGQFGYFTINRRMLTGFNRTLSDVLGSKRRAPGSNRPPRAKARRPKQKRLS